MKANSQLKDFLSPYSDDIQSLTWNIRDVITELVPEANELIWDNYNAVALAYSKSEKLKDAFCHIAVYAKHVNFGFNRGAELTSNTLQLNGKGKLIRHITVKNWATFPIDELKPIIFEALALSEELNPSLKEKNIEAKSLVMSISEKKLRPKK